MARVRPIPVKLRPCTLPANAGTPTGPAVYTKLNDPADPAGWNDILAGAQEAAVPGRPGLGALRFRNSWAAESSRSRSLLPPDAGFFCDFWHEDAVERIHHESQGWPALAQGLAREVVRRCRATQSFRSAPEILEAGLHAVQETMRGPLSERLLQGVSAPAVPFWRLRVPLMQRWLRERGLVHAADRRRPVEDALQPQRRLSWKMATARI